MKIEKIHGDSNAGRFSYRKLLICSRCLPIHNLLIELLFEYYIYLNNLGKTKNKNKKELPVKSQMTSNTKSSELINVASVLVERAYSSLVLLKIELNEFFMI